MLPLEAMAYGGSVIVSNRSSLPEIVGSAGIQIDPFDVNKMSQMCKRLCVDSAFSKGFVVNGIQRAGQFFWSDAAQAFVWTIPLGCGLVENYTNDIYLLREVRLFFFTQ